MNNFRSSKNRRFLVLNTYRNIPMLTWGVYLIFMWLNVSTHQLKFIRFVRKMEIFIIMSRNLTIFSNLLYDVMWLWSGRSLTASRNAVFKRQEENQFFLFVEIFYQYYFTEVVLHIKMCKIWKSIWQYLHFYLLSFKLSQTIAIIF